jgi:hypothetical protein
MLFGMFPCRRSGCDVLSEPVRQRCGIPGIEHGVELTDKVVGAAELRAVLE